MMRPVLLLSLMLWPLGAQAQRPATSDDFLSLTRCDAERAVTVTRADVRDSLLVVQLEAHEAVHRRQSADFPTCEAFISSLRSARAIIEAELPRNLGPWRTGLMSWNVFAVNVRLECTLVKCRICCIDNILIYMI